jgi:hypothetical protein
MNAKHREFSICLLSGILFLCLACLEIPEMSSLTDDVSNDFTILTTPSATSTLIIRTGIANTERVKTDASRWVQVVSPRRTRPGAGPPSRHILTLHSIRRT